MASILIPPAVLTVHANNLSTAANGIRMPPRLADRDEESTIDARDNSIQAYSGMVGSVALFAGALTGAAQSTIAMVDAFVEQDRELARR